MAKRRQKGFHQTFGEGRVVGRVLERNSASKNILISGKIYNNTRIEREKTRAVDLEGARRPDHQKGKLLKDRGEGGLAARFRGDRGW